MGSVLFPLRTVVVVLLFLLMWPIAMLRTAGLSEEELSRPIIGWRRWLLHAMMLSINRVMFFTLGFVWIEVKGRRADVKEAPVLVAAPHSSFLDMVILMPTKLPTVVSRSENVNLPVIGGNGVPFGLGSGGGYGLGSDWDVEVLFRFLGWSSPGHGLVYFWTGPCQGLQHSNRVALAQ